VLIVRRAGVPSSTPSVEALCFAVIAGRHEEVSDLLQAKASPDVALQSLLGQACPGYTALHFATGGNEYQTVSAPVVRALLEGRADPSIPSNSKLTPLHMVAAANAPGRPPSESEGVIRLLIEHKAAAEKRSEAGWTALHFAARGHSNRVKVLLEMGCRADASTISGATPAQEAARFGDRESAAMLASAEEACGLDDDVRSQS